MSKRANRVGTITLNIAVSDELHAKVKHLADEQGISVAAWVRKVLGSPALRRYRKAPKELKSK